MDSLNFHYFTVPLICLCCQIQPCFITHLYVIYFSWDWHTGPLAILCQNIRLQCSLSSSTPSPQNSWDNQLVPRWISVNLTRKSGHPSFFNNNSCSNHLQRDTTVSLGRSVNKELSRPLPHPLLSTSSSSKTTMLMSLTVFWQVGPKPCQDGRQSRFVSFDFSLFPRLLTWWQLSLKSTMTEVRSWHASWPLFGALLLRRLRVGWGLRSCWPYRKVAILAYLIICTSFCQLCSFVYRFSESNADKISRFWNGMWYSCTISRLPSRTTTWSHSSHSLLHLFWWVLRVINYLKRLGGNLGLLVKNWKAGLFSISPWNVFITFNPSFFLMFFLIREISSFSSPTTHQKPLKILSGGRGKLTLCQVTLISISYYYC